ncbi:Gmad2 immunoglobulin-like domain-containing protein [Patescibacteria group bacterium]|nr:Gmad2 immunoglobulin-like domain-containing protein [Patescibacteria group bacterium]
MTKKTSMWFVVTIIAFIGILTIVAVVVTLYYLRGEAIQKKENQNTVSDMKDTKFTVYTAADGSWSVEYPSDWNTIESSDDSFGISENENVAWMDNGDIYFDVVAKKSFDELVDEFYIVNDDIEEESVNLGGVYAIKLTGKQKDIPSMFPPGTVNIVTLVEMDNGKVLTIKLYNKDMSAVYDRVLYSLMFDGEISSSKTFDNNIASTSASGNIVVYTPGDLESISSPYEVTGKGRVFENVLNYELTDQSGKVLADGFAVTASPDVGQFGEFEIDLVFVAGGMPGGTLEVFSLSAKNGSREDVVTIDVKFE